MDTVVLVTKWDGQGLPLSTSASTAGEDSFEFGSYEDSVKFYKAPLAWGYRTRDS